MAEEVVQYTSESDFNSDNEWINNVIKEVQDEYNKKLKLDGMIYSSDVVNTIKERLGWK